MPSTAMPTVLSENGETHHQSTNTQGNAELVAGVFRNVSALMGQPNEAQMMHNGRLLITDVAKVFVMELGGSISTLWYHF